MLPKANRLKKKKDFEKVLKKGQGFKENFLLFKIAKNNLKLSRFGFVISTKFSKKATVRNKMKRRLSEIIRTRLSKIKKGKDGIIIVVPGLKIDNYWELEEMVNRLFEKAKLYEL